MVAVRRSHQQAHTAPIRILSDTRVKVRRHSWVALQRVLAVLDRITERTLCVVDDGQNDAGYGGVVPN